MTIHDVVNLDSVALVAARKALRASSRGRVPSAWLEKDRLVETVLGLLNGRPLPLALDVLGRVTETIEAPLREQAERELAGAAQAPREQSMRKERWDVEAKTRYRESR